MSHLSDIDRIVGFIAVVVVALASIVRWRKWRTTACLLMLIGSILLLSRTLGFAVATSFSPRVYPVWDFTLMWILPSLGGLFFCAGYTMDSFGNKAYGAELPNQSSEPALSSGTPPAGQESRPR
jgi:hypothetical protein